MNEITKQTIPKFRQKFNTLEKGVILHVDLYFVTDHINLDIDVTVLYEFPDANPTKDPPRLSTNQVDVILHFEDVVWTNYRVLLNEPAPIIMESGVDVIDDLLHFNFSGQPEKFDYITIPNREIPNPSGLYIIAKRAFWDVKPPTLLPLKKA